MYGREDDPLQFYECVVHACADRSLRGRRIYLGELRTVLDTNISYAMEFIRREFPGVSVSRPQGTYMLFLDCTDWCAAHHQTIEELQRAGMEVGVIWQDGRPFHGACHIRMNLALPHSRVKEAFERLKQYVFLD